jgi:deoxycytidylate deaminase
MQSPPEHVIAEAVAQAKCSPCAKSKRGAVVFDAFHKVVGIGYNHQPEGFACDGSEFCKSACPRLCLHAEDVAIRGLDPDYSGYGLDLVHVKVVDSALVPGGPPSCWQCSRVIAQIGCAVWLFEAQRWHTECRCKACWRTTIIPQGGSTTGVCTQCNDIGNLLDRGKVKYDITSGEWRRYEAHAFHEITLRNSGLHSARAREK